MSFVQKKILTHRNRRVLWTILLTLVCFYVMFGHNYRLVFCVGESMDPTYKGGEMLLMKRVKGEYNPKRFDIVIINDSTEKEKITKRVLGLPGEKLEMTSGRIYINDKPLNDPFYVFAGYSDENIYRIPANCVWVIGDNREESLYGIFLKKEIEGLIR